MMWLCYFFRIELSSYVYKPLQMPRIAFYAVYLRLSTHYLLFISDLIIYHQIRSIVYTFSTFFFCYAGFVAVAAGAGFVAGPFGPPNKLFAIFCFALSSGATNFFFSFYLYFGASIETNTGGFTYLSS